MTPDQPDTGDEERERIADRRKAQMWLIAVTMTASFCIGSSLLFLILWLLLK